MHKNRVRENSGKTKNNSFFRVAQNQTLLLVGVFLLTSVLGGFLLTRVYTPAYAAINEELNFQARLLDTTGGLVDDGNYNVQFNIYSGGDGVIGGGDETLEWTGSYLKGNSQGIDVVNGYVNAQLGETASDMPSGDLSTVDWNNSTLWLSINIGNPVATSTACDTTADFGTNCGGDGEMGPYIRLASTPYAFNAGQLEGRGADQFVQLNPGVTPQAVSSTTAALAVNQTNTGNIVTLQDGGETVFSVEDGGDVVIGSDNNQGNLLLSDGGTGGNFNTVTIQAVSGLAQDVILTIPDGASATDTICTEEAGNCTGGGTGITTIGAVDGVTKNANGAVISGTTLYLQTADATTAGLVSSSAQTFGGAKTFQDNIVLGEASTSNGSVQFQNATNAFTVTLDGSNQTTANTTIRFPDTGAATNDTVCLLTLANCVGSGGGGAIGGSGTLNTVALFTPDGNNIGNSVITQGGTTVSIAGNLFVDGSLGSISTSSTGNNLNFSRNAANYIQATGGSGTLNLGVASNNSVINIQSDEDVSIDSGTLFIDASDDEVRVGGNLNVNGDIETSGTTRISDTGAFTGTTGEFSNSLTVNSSTAGTGGIYLQDGASFGLSRNSSRVSVTNGLSGRIVNRNSEFQNGTNGYLVYNNAGGGAVSIANAADSTAPNTSGKVLRVSYDGTGPSSPGYGGARITALRCSGTNNAVNGYCYREGNRYSVRIWANIPVGRTIVHASNATGTGADYKWITSTAGTGDWQLYEAIQTIGIGGTFSSTGFWYVSGGADVAFDWDIARLEMVGIDESPSVQQTPSLNIGYVQDATPGFGGLIVGGSALFNGELEVASGEAITIGGESIEDFAGTGLTVDGSGVLNASLSGLGGIGGSGTNNTIALFTPDGNSIGNSILTQSGTAVTNTGSLSVTDDFIVDTNTLFVDASENNVGIGTLSPGASLQIGTTDQFGIYINQHSDTVDRWYLVGTINDNNGDISVDGTLSSHGNSNSNVDIKVRSRDGLTVLGSAFGEVGTSADIVVYDDVASNQYRVYLKTDVWGLVNVNAKATDGAVLLYDETFTTTDPSGTYGADIFTLSADAGQIVRTDTNGNFSIGATTPDRQLQVTNADTAYLRLENEDTSLIVGQVIGALEFEQNDSGGAGVKASIQAVANGTNGQSSLVFNTNNDNTEAFRVNSLGNVLIGDATGDDRLEVTGGNLDVNGNIETNDVTRISSTGALSVTTGNFTGAVTINNNSTGADPATSLNFGNTYDNSGEPSANKIVLWESGSTQFGIGVSTGDFDLFTQNNFRFNSTSGAGINENIFTIGVSGNTTTEGTFTAAGLITANGGLTVGAGDAINISGDSIEDFAGTGLTVDGSGVLNASLSGLGGVGGSGTTNALPRFTPDGTTLGDSLLSQNGNFIELDRAGASPATQGILIVDPTTANNYGGQLYFDDATSEFRISTLSLGTEYQGLRVARDNGNVGVGGTAAFDDQFEVTTGNIDISTGNLELNDVTRISNAGAFTGTGAGITALNASNISSGTLSVARGGTGAGTLTNGGVLLGSGTGAVTATAVLGNGQLLIGNGSGDPTLATLTAGSGVDIANGAGSITISSDLEELDRNYVGTTIRAGAGTTKTYYDIATLPASSSSSLDHLVVEVSGGPQWTGGTSTERFIFKNRGGFIYAYSSQGDRGSNANGVEAYEQLDGSVDLYYFHDSGFTSATVKAYGVQAGGSLADYDSQSILVSTTGSTATPSGTSVFNSKTDDPNADFRIGDIDVNGNIQTNGTTRISNTGAFTGTSATFSSLTPNRLVTTTTGGQLTNTITAANLLSSVTGTTGTGNLVFSASPTFTGTVNTSGISATGNVQVGGVLYGDATTGTFLNLDDDAPVGSDNDATLGSYTNINLLLDTNNNDADSRYFAIGKNSALADSSVDLFVVEEGGDVNIVSGDLELNGTTRISNTGAFSGTTGDFTGQVNINRGATTAYPIQLVSSSVTTSIGALNGSYTHYDTTATGGNYFYDDITIAAVSTFRPLGATVASGLITANGGLTVGTGDAITIGGDSITDFAGTGLTVDGAGNLNVDVGGAGGVESLLLAGNTGSNQTLTDGNTINVRGDGTVLTSAASATDTVTLSVNANSIGNTQLQFDTGQNLTTVSNPSFNSGALTTTGGNALLFDGGDSRITVHDGFGNFNILSGLSSTNTILEVNNGIRSEYGENGTLDIEVYTGVVGATGVESASYYFDQSELNISGAGLDVVGNIQTGNVTRISSAGAFTGTGAGITSLNASNISTGTLSVARGGTGAGSLTNGGVLLGSGTGAVTATAVLGNGQLLIGDGSGDPAVATLTEGTGIDITNGAGTITIAADLSALGGISGSGTDNYVPLWNGTDALDSSFINQTGVNTLSFEGARDVDVNTGTGSVAINGSAGGWATGYRFNGNAGTDLGGFGALGSADSLTNFWIGPSYTTPYLQLLNGGDLAVDGTTLAVDASTNRVGIGDATPDASLDIQSTTTQLRVSYDDTNQTAFVTGSTGILTVTPSGGQTNIIGDVDVSSRLAVGNNAGITANQALRVAYSTSEEATTYGIVVNAVNDADDAGGTLGVDNQLYGINLSANNTSTEDIAGGFDSDTYGSYITAESSAARTFRYLRGQYGRALVSSDASANQGSATGATGEAVLSSDDPAAVLTSAIGLQGTARGTTVAGGSGNSITTAYAFNGSVLPYRSNINNAYGSRTYVYTQNGYEGDITNAYGTYSRVRVDSDDGGDIQNATAGYFLIDKRATANNVTDTATGIEIQLDQVADVDNYAIYIDEGDIVLDSDGDGLAGGASTSGDLIIGEGQDLELYHNGVSSNIINNTGVLNINSAGGIALSGNVTSAGLIAANGGIDLNNSNLDDVQNIIFDESSSQIYDNANGLVFDGGDGTADLLVYDNLIYSDTLLLGYTGAANLTTYDTNESLAVNTNGTGAINLNAATNVSGLLTANGGIELEDADVNDVGNLLFNPGNAEGICFWQSCANYSINMGNIQVDQGTVTDYSLHSNIGGTVGRGFTWGSSRTAVSASINALTGAFDTDGSVTAAGGIKVTGSNLITDFTGTGLSVNGSAQLEVVAGAGSYWAQTGSNVIYNTGSVGINMGATVPLPGLAVNKSGLIGGANNGVFDIGTGRIAAGASIYSYGGICTSNSSGGCVGTGGVVLGTTNTSAAINLQNDGDAFFDGSVDLGDTNTDTLSVNARVDTDFVATVEATSVGVTESTQTLSLGGTLINNASAKSIIGANGFPITALLDASTGDVKVIVCTNATCSTNNVRTIAGPGGDVLQDQIDMVLPADNRLLIAFANDTDGDAVLARCSDSVCTTITQQQIVDADSIDDVGVDINPATGFPVLSTGNKTSFDIEIIECTNATCSTRNTHLISAATEGQDTDIKFNGVGDDYFVTSTRYVSSPDQRVVVYKCDNISCSSNTRYESPSSTAGRDAELVIPSDGRPIILAHSFSSPYQLSTYKCDDTDCSSATQTDHASGNVANYPHDMALASDDTAIFTVRSPGNNLDIIKCGDADCTTTNTTSRTISSSDSIGHSNSIVIGNDGLPYVTYVNTTGTDSVSIVRCGVYDCMSTGSTSYSGGLNIGQADLAWRGLYVDTINEDRLDAAFRVTQEGEVRISTYAAATATTVCRNAGTGALSVCSSNQRYKENIQDLGLGLGTIRQLEAHQFDWKADGRTDLGFIAEEVEQINPLLAQYEADGSLSGVKYSQLTALLIEGVQELDLQVQDNTSRIQTLEAAIFDNEFTELTVSDEATVQTLVVNGSADIQEDLTVLGITTVIDLVVSGRLISEGDLPTAEIGDVLGAATDTIEIEGNDTAGLITIDILAATPLDTDQPTDGEIAVIEFDEVYAEAPRISLTPKDAESAQLRTYVETTVDGFMVYSIDAPEEGKVYSFDYIIIQ